MMCMYADNVWYQGLVECAEGTGVVLVLVLTGTGLAAEGSVRDVHCALGPAQHK